MVSRMRENIGMATLAILFAATSMGCSSDDAIGPQGPPGPAGNANVFTLGLRFEMIDAIVNGTVASVQYTVPDLSPSVVDEGAVLLFFRDQGTWTAMPYTFGVESVELPAVDYTVAFGFGYDVEFLEIFYEVSSEAVELASLPDREIKAVIIDGFPLGKQGIDFTNWETVKATFGLDD